MSFDGLALKPVPVMVTVLPGMPLSGLTAVIVVWAME
jgi:hypothetical protein